jgi:alpha-ribazole phosphatase
MQVYLIRHTTPQVSKGICYGSTNIGLNEQLFTQQAQAIKSITDALNIANYHSSSLQRCTQLSQYLSGNNYLCFDALQEMHFGDWENTTWASIDEKVLNNWMNNFVTVATPNGESYEQLYARVNNYITTELLNSQYESIAIICHAGVIRCLLHYTLNIPLQDTFKINIPYSSVWHLTLQQQSAYNQLVKVYYNN